MKLSNAPIIEAVLDIECDLPPALDFASLEESARELLRGEYVKFRKQHFLKHHIESKIEESEPVKTSTLSGIQGYQFLSEDGKQVVQIRSEGYSFNRLSPYSCLDDYLPEIERTWKQFVALVKPVLVRVIRLRYINRLPLPAIEDRVELENFLRIAPRFPDDRHLAFAGFLNQSSMVEKDTGNEVGIVLASQKPEGGVFPVILDITATDESAVEPENWPMILSKIQCVRNLKNKVFQDILTERCLQQFQ